MQYPYPVTSISIKKIKNYQIKKSKKCPLYCTQPQFFFSLLHMVSLISKLETCSPASRM